ncbi:MAG: hypothetical protein WCO93_03785 [bacterium]
MVNMLQLKYLSSLFPVLFLLFIISGCGQSSQSMEVTTDQFIIRDFNPLSNWPFDLKGNRSSNPVTDKMILLDYTEAMKKGFIIPTTRQTGNGFFEFEFSIKNTGKSPQKFCYKIYYQNESYKFPERDETDTAKLNGNCWENFYGSWEEASKTFNETEIIPADDAFHKVSDSFRIVGNPRDEKRYYRDGRNDRWKRNPRVGNYSFLLVVTCIENISQRKIPEYIQNICLQNNQVYINPYFYFLFGEGRSLRNTLVQQFPGTLKVVASPDPGSGIYINPDRFTVEAMQRSETEICGHDSSLYRSAAFEQFIHYVDPSTKMNHIPVIADVLKDGYSRMDYNWNKQFYRKDELVAVTATTAARPCETVISDPLNHKITIKNPKAEFGKWQKQNVGVITRHGLTYGKWTVKCKLTEILNKNGMWNGITNAIWLITQELGEWNHRRDCNNAGYLANYYGGQQDQRVKTVGYSEIDFEILKTVPYCPSWILPPAYSQGGADQDNLDSWNIPFPEEITGNDDKVVVACTNWDMACWQPAEFHEGCWPVRYKDQTFWTHRWDKNYRAITEKTIEPDDELFGSPFYYFQIDWQPEMIIWRIGPSKDKLRVVGYMDSSVTSIPNNQMLMIITQEFHNTKWWIGSPYSQDNIPFPENELVGEIYELTIE